MKIRMGLIMSGAVAWVGLAQGVMVSLDGVDTSTLTTGELLEGVGESGVTTNVVEIDQLIISARSGGTNQVLNSNKSSFGINNTDSPEDDAEALDAGEKVIFSFNKKIQINRLDFSKVGVGESIFFGVGGQVVEILDMDLSNRISDYLDTNLVVEANVEIEFYTTGSSVIGLNGIDLTVLGGDPTLSLVFDAGIASVSAFFDGTAPTNYVLQYRADLASGDWETISDSFSTNSDWQVVATNSCGYFRAVAP